MINETSLCRRHSFPPQIRNDSILTEPKSNFLEEVIELGPTLLCPLTFKNLELHTKAFPSTKDARRHSTLLFVESQISLVDMETTLREQHEREVTAYLKSRSVEPEMTTLKPSILRRLKHFLLSGRKKQRNKVPEQKNQMIKKTMAKTNNDNGSQKRDSGISLLFSHHSKQDSIVAYRYPY